MVQALAIAAVSATAWWFVQQRTLRLLQQQRAEIEKHEALERERSRIARDMHDDLGSGLSAIHLLSNFAKNRVDDPAIKAEMEKIAAPSAALNQNIREIIWTVNSADDSLASLVHFLRRYCNDFSEASQMECRLPGREIIPEISLSGEQRRNLFLCVKEALNNIAKHAKSTRMDVEITIFKVSKLEIVITDDGQGFDLEAALKRGGNGLRNIQKRMEDIGGQAHFSSSSSGAMLRLEMYLGKD